MRRLFWMGVGAAGAVYLAQRARRAVRSLPETMVGQVEQAGARASSALAAAVTDFRAARAEREVELVEALLVEPAAGADASAPSGRRPRRRGDAGDLAWADDDDEDDF